MYLDDLPAVRPDREIGLALAKWLGIDTTRLTAITVSVRIGELPRVTCERFVSSNPAPGDVPVLESFDINLSRATPCRT